MPVKIRILSAANRHMQRLGFLKLLAHQTARTETSNLATLGSQLVQAVTKRVRITPPYSESLREYVHIRLFDRIYADLRKAMLNGNPSPVAIELQDLYLADPKLPSSTGKLGENSRRFYPYLATALDIIKPGTWSAMTRAWTLLAVTPKEELAAFESHNPAVNPFCFTPEQSAVLLYCLLDNDAEILFPLFQQILSLPGDTFDERMAGDFLPGIIRQSGANFRNSALTHEDRERLAQLDKVADNIERWKGKPYTGGGAREEHIRVRIEPFVDLRLFTKPDRHRFAYRITPAFRRLVTDWPGADSTDMFLEDRFFTSLAGMNELRVKDATDEEARAALAHAGEQLKSTLGYSPILDCALLAGIRLLFGGKRVLEIGRSRELLKAWQKAAPDVVRFTVDRMGAMAYVKFLKPVAPPGVPSKT